ASGEWSVALTDAEVRDGFVYRVRAGSVRTPEYRVRVRPAPAVTRLEAVYVYPKYLAQRDEKLLLHGERKIEVPAGTEVVLTVRASCPVKAGRLDLEDRHGKKSFLAERVADDPQALTVRFTPTDSGNYGLRFDSAEGDRYADTRSYSLRVV